MNENIIASKIQILIEATWECGFYAGAIEHGNMIQTEKQRYRNLLIDALDKRSYAKKDLLKTIGKQDRDPDVLDESRIITLGRKSLEVDCEDIR